MEQAVVKILLLGICGYGSNYIKEISERDIPGIKIEGICEVVPNAADLYPIIKEQNIPIYQTPEDFRNRENRSALQSSGALAHSVMWMSLPTCAFV